MKKKCNSLRSHKNQTDDFDDNELLVFTLLNHLHFPHHPLPNKLLIFLILTWLQTYWLHQRKRNPKLGCPHFEKINIQVEHKKYWLLLQYKMLRLVQTENKRKQNHFNSILRKFNHNDDLLNRFPIKATSMILLKVTQWNKKRSLHQYKRKKSILHQNQAIKVQLKERDLEKN